MKRAGFIITGICLLAFAANAAQVSLSPKAPAIGPDDISNLKGAATDDQNVTEGDHDATYVADDRPVQGQTFRTGTNSASYQLRAVTLRQAVHPTHALISDLTYTIRITEPSGDKLSVIASEAAVVPEAMTGNISTISDGSETGSGSGTFITFTFDKPITLKPGTTYGFDVSGGNTRHYWQTDGTVSNAYPGGVAYSVTGGEKLTSRKGDRVFVVSLTAAADLRANQASTAPLKAATGR